LNSTVPSSHRLTEMLCCASLPTEARMRPSGEKASCVTPLRWKPRPQCRILSESARHTSTEGSGPISPVATICLEGCICTHRISCVWPEKMRCVCVLGL
jgi:hypothetical protein